MYQDEVKSGMDKFKDGFAVFLSRYFRWLAAGFGAVLLILAALGIWSVQRNVRIDESARLAETLEEDFNQWLNTAEGEEKSQLEEEIKEGIERARIDYPGLYAEQRALFVQGHFHYSREEYQKAAESYLALADQFPKSYLAPVSLYNAGSCYDESNQAGKAAEPWKELLEKYWKKTPLTTQTLFSLGRISEELGNEKEAVGYYRRIEDSFPQSDWTKLAKQRIIVLTIDE